MTLGTGAKGGRRSWPLHDSPYLFVFDAHFVLITFELQYQKVSVVGIKCLLLQPASKDAALSLDTRNRLQEGPREA